MRALLIALLTLALLAPAASAGDDPSQHPPTMPSKGKKRISCKRARQIVRKKPLDPIKHYQYFDWTKGGNGPWSDVYYRHDHKVVVGAIMQGY